MKWTTQRTGAHAAQWQGERSSGWSRRGPSRSDRSCWNCAGRGAATAGPCEKRVEHRRPHRLPSSTRLSPNRKGTALRTRRLRVRVPSGACMRPNIETKRNAGRAERPKSFEAWVSIAAQAYRPARFAVYVPLAWTTMRKSIAGEVEVSRGDGLDRGQTRTTASSPSSSSHKRPWCQR